MKNSLNDEKGCDRVFKNFHLVIFSPTQYFAIIGVSAKKNSGGEGDKVLPKFCNICQNHDFLIVFGHYGYEKKFTVNSCEQSYIKI